MLLLNPNDERKNKQTRFENLIHTFIKLETVEASHFREFTNCHS